MKRFAIVLALAASGVTAVYLTRSPAAPAAPEATEASATPAAAPRGPMLDATQIISGRISMERLPPEVGTALERFSDEIVRNSEETATKQVRIHGVCAPGSAIRVIAEDGSVRCQAVAHGVVSVTAVTAMPRLSSTISEVGNVPGGIGRYQVGGENDYLIAPIALPEGATVTGLSYVVFDAAADSDSEAFLYRSDNEAMASVSSDGADERVRTVSTDSVRLRKIDAAHYSYFIYFQVSSAAKARLMPISASVSYKLQ
jgi:hypothetical protein